MCFSADSFAISKLITIFAKYANGITNLRKWENISIFIFDIFSLRSVCYGRKMAQYEQVQ